MKQTILKLESNKFPKILGKHCFDEITIFVKTMKYDLKCSKKLKKTACKKDKAFHNSEIKG